ncbi:MAG: TMEM175 family protein [Chitinophagales bacterium]
MTTNRLEAFSDGVLAIIITIMVLEMKVPEGTSFSALKDVLPVFLTYVGSFIYIGIYWNNHHHLMHATGKVNGKILWANLNLLFWLSLFPFVTGWMGENHFEKNPVALYGLVLFMAAIAYKLLSYVVIQNEGESSILATAYKGDIKGTSSIFIYFIGILASYFFPVISILLYIAVAIMWFIPDKRIEVTLKD